MRLMVLVCALVLISGLVVPQNPEDELMKADRDFAKETAAHRLDGWMSVFTKNSVLFSENPILGADAIRLSYKKLFDDPSFKLEWEPNKAEIFPSGNMGYTVGRYQGVFKNPKGKIEQQSGTYLTVWRKQPDGSWKVVADGGAPDPAEKAK